MQANAVIGHVLHVVLIIIKHERWMFKQETLVNPPLESHYSSYVINVISYPYLPKESNQLSKFFR